MVNAGKCWARHPGGATETGVKHQGERPQGKISEQSDILAESFRRDEVRPVERQAGIPAGTSMGTGAKGPQALSKKRNRNGEVWLEEGQDSVGLWAPHRGVTHVHQN